MTDLLSPGQPTSSGQCIPQITLGMPYCSRSGGKHWKGQSLRAITNCLKLLRVGPLAQCASYQPYAGCFSVDICSSVTAKPAKPLQWCKGTKAWGAKEDQVGSSRMKHTLEEEKEEKKICTLCNFSVVTDRVNLPSVHM